jgi:hypothetical protein
MTSIKTMIGAAALIAAGLVSTDYLVAGPTAPTNLIVATQDVSPVNSSVDFVALRTEASEALKALAAKRDGKVTEDSSLRPTCLGQTWPYYSSACLIDGGASRVPARIVSLDRPAAPQAAKPIQVASR